MTERKSIPSINLSVKLGITQRSAWFMLQRIRSACDIEIGGSSKLWGTVEVDETYLGGKEKNKHESKKRHAGRGAVGKTPVVGVRNRNGRVYAKVVEATDKETLQRFIKRCARPEARVYTDESRAHKGLKKHFADHKTVNHSAKQYVEGDVHTNGIEGTWAVVKSNYRTHNSYSPKHAPRYINESLYRLNERNKDMLKQISSLIRRTRGLRLTYKMPKESKRIFKPYHPLFCSRRSRINGWRCAPLDVFNELPDQLNPFISNTPPIPIGGGFNYSLHLKGDDNNE